MSEEIVKVEPAKRKNVGYVFIILILILVIAGLGFFLNRKTQHASDLQLSLDSLKTEYKVVSAALENAGFDTPGSMRDKLMAMLDSYDSLDVNNAELQDSVNEQRARIETVLAELEEAKKSSRGWQWEYRQMKKKFELVEEGYNDLIDKVAVLKEENDNLKTNLAERNRQLTDVSYEREIATERAEKAEEELSEGRKLNAVGVVSQGIRLRANKKQKVETKAKRVEKVKCAFTIAANPLVNKGQKTIYLRVISPSGSLMKGSRSKTFTTGGKTLAFSDAKTLDYKGTNVDMEIYFTGQSYEKGSYKVELYENGVIIGTDSFLLE